MGSRPDGAARPNNSLARAGPPIVPGCQAYKTAPAFAATSWNVSGRPARITVTMGLAVAWMASASASCAPGRSKNARDLASPDRICSSPKNSNTTSARRAASTAAENPSWPRSRLFRNPAAYSTRSAPSSLRKAASGVCTSDGRPSMLHVPIWSTALSASGPMMATVRTESLSGSSPPSFFNRTALSTAVRSASSSDCAFGATSTSAGIGCSNSPSRNFSRRIFRTASSMSGMETSPCSRSDFRWSK